MDCTHRILRPDPQTTDCFLTPGFPPFDYHKHCDNIYAVMSPQELKSARHRKGWSQHEAAVRLGVSQSYLAMLESGSRQLPSRSVRKFRKTYHLPPTSLPLPIALNFKTSEDAAGVLAADLAALGYEGFAHLRSRARRKNPAVVLLTALAQPDLEARLFEALPWLMVQYSDMRFDWLVQQAKLLDVQNRLGFVATLAREVVERQTPNERDRVEALRKLEDVLENSKLAKVELLRKTSVGPRERQWLTENRSEEASRWNLLTDWRPEMLRYASS
jgi:transcriptional regulator with XRE-family HTH domain